MPEFHRVERRGSDVDSRNSDYGKVAVNIDNNTMWIQQKRTILLNMYNCVNDHPLQANSKMKGHAVCGRLPFNHCNVSTFFSMGTINIRHQRPMNLLPSKYAT